MVPDVEKLNMLMVPDGLQVMLPGVHYVDKAIGGTRCPDAIGVQDIASVQVL